MAQPGVYASAHSFVADSANIPDFPGQNIDVEFAAIAAVFAQYHTNIALLQNDDGTLKNGSVDTDQLSATVAAALGNVAATATVAAYAATASAGAATATAQVALATTQATNAATSATTATTQATNAAASAVAAAASAAATGISGLTNHGIPVASAATTLNASIVLTDGQLIVGATSANPVAKTLSGDATLAASGALTLANGAGTRTNLGLAIGTNVQAWDAQLDEVAAQLLVNGYSNTSFNAGTKTTGTFTPAPASGNFQHYTNGGAHTLAAPATTCTMIIECTNASAGTITFGSFSIIDGDTYSATGTKKHLFYITKTNSFARVTVTYVTGT